MKKILTASAAILCCAMTMMAEPVSPETARQISTLSRLGVKAGSVALHADIAPMVTARWDQDKPYNASCPKTDGQPFLTGCMATALSQVMYYHRWPQGADCRRTACLHDGRRSGD